MQLTLCKNGIKCSKRLDMLKVAFGECTVSQKSVYKWYKLFTKGPEGPSTSTINENTKAMKKIVMENRRITIGEVAEDVGITDGSFHTIFWDILGLKCVAAKFVPKLLNFDLLTCHCLFVIFLAKNNTVIIPQPPYSPDLAPCDFFLFPRLKRPMNGRRFATIEEIKTESLRELKDIPKSAYQKCFEDSKKRWHKCIISEGDYFDGDNIEIHK